MSTAAVPLRPEPAAGPRFLVALAALVLAFPLLELAEPEIDIWLGPANRLTAEATTVLLRASGLEVERRGSVVAHPSGFGIYVYYLCTGLPLALVLLVGLGALPGRRGGKPAAAAAGIALLLVVNQLRLLSLFWIGLRLPGAYDFAHRWVGEPVMLGLVCVVWIAWVRHRPRTGTPP